VLQSKQMLTEKCWNFNEKVATPRRQHSA